MKPGSTQINQRSEFTNTEINVYALINQEITHIFIRKILQGSNLMITGVYQ